MIRRIWLPLVICLLIGLAGCNRDPKAASKKYVTVGNNFFGQGKFKDASLMYRKALQKDMKNGEAYYRLALVDLKLQLVAEAVGAFHRAIELQPNNSDAMVKLTDIYLGAYATSPTRPKQYLDEVDTLLKQLEKRDAFQFQRLSGYRRLMENDTAGAVLNFRAANRLKPNDPGVCLILFQALASTNHFEEAVQLAQGLIAVKKDYSAIYEALYREYIRRGNTAAAEQTLKLRAANNPKDSDALIALSAHYYNLHQRSDMLGVLNQILSNRGSFPQANLLVGDFYFRLREFDQAIRLYDEGIRNDPAKKTDYQKRIIEALMFQGKRIEATQLVDSLLKSNSDDLDARAMRAALILQGGKREELQGAINELQSIVSKMPSNPVIRYNLGRALLAKEELDAARVQFLEAIRIYPAYIPPRLALAQLQLFKGEFANAQKTADEVLQIDGANITARLIRTSALIGSGDATQARTELEKVVAANPDSRDGIFQLAMLNLRENKTKTAEEGFSRLAKMSPPDLRGQLGLVNVQLAQGKTDSALQILAEQLQKDPNRTELRLAYANTAARVGKFDIAIREFKQMASASPKSEDLLLRLGEAYRLSGNLGDASKSFDQARALNPNNPVPLVQLALLNEQAGRLQEARPYYEKVLKLQPDNPIALNNLAYRLAEGGADLDQALTYAQRARKQVPPASPLSDDISDTLGWIYIKKNLHDNAIGIFRDLLTKQPTQAVWRYHLAMALYQKGDRPQARKECQTALKTASPADKVKIQELLSRIG